jgi:hypothetical protein
MRLGYKGKRLIELTVLEAESSNSIVFALRRVS